MDLKQLEGSVLAGFVLTKHLGEGGMAAVFRGENVARRKILRAIKVIRPELAARGEFRERFLDEADILERLTHPNVVKFFGVREDHGWLVMELELLDGKTLAQILHDRNRQPLPVEWVVSWIRDASVGVAAAHALHIVHRDLKPENLFLTKPERRVVVLDFGIAKALDDVERAQNRLTKANTINGSPPYMAPEVCQGAVPDAAADVYALGVSAYELLLGYHPFEAGGRRLTGAQMMVQHLQQSLPPIRSLRPDLPEALEGVLLRATAKDPAIRFRSARELADSLEALGMSLDQQEAQDAQDAMAGNRTRFEIPTANLGGTPSTTAGREVAVPTRKPNHAKWILSAGATLSVGLAAALIVALSRDELATDAPPTMASPVAVEPEAAPEPENPNPWVRIEPPNVRTREPLYLGLPRESADPNALGFRPSRRIQPPTMPYELQQHEVSWGELDPWLDANEVDLARPAFVSESSEARANYPAVGIPWEVALAYCESLGGSLPTEEQWEYAARGPELRPNAWGSQTLDTYSVTVFHGPDGQPVPIQSSRQDVTPDTADRRLFDLTGNAQEWTLDLWRDDRSGNDESWVQSQGRTYRAVRGLPLRMEGTIPTMSAAYRMPLCVTMNPVRNTNTERNDDLTDEQRRQLELLTRPPCPPSVVAEGVGFRCARPAASSRRGSGASSAPTPDQQMTIVLPSRDEVGYQLAREGLSSREANDVVLGCTGGSSPVPARTTMLLRLETRMRDMGNYDIFEGVFSIDSMSPAGGSFADCVASGLTTLVNEQVGRRVRLRRSTRWETPFDVVRGATSGVRSTEESREPDRTRGFRLGTGSARPRAGALDIDDLLDRALGGVVAADPAANDHGLREQPDRDDVARALRSVSSRVESCGGGTAGVANAHITFASSGRVTNVNVTDVPLDVQSCVARGVRSAVLPQFSRPTFNVNFPFRVR